MLRYYLRTAIRSLRKQPVYTAINLSGLALGIACCLLMLAFVQHERLHDRFHENSDRIFRVVRPDNESGQEDGFVASMPGPMAPAMADDFPEVEATVRIAGGARYHLRRGERVIEHAVHYADQSLFDAFSFDLLVGDPSSALARPDGIVLSQRVAVQLFSDIDVLNEPVRVTLLDSTVTFFVSGVLAYPDGPSSLTFDVLLPIEASKLGSSPFFREKMFSSWALPRVETFVLLAEGSSAEAVSRRLPDFIERHYDAADAPAELRFQPLQQMHLANAVSSRLVLTSNPRYSAVLAAIALFVLFVASANYVTLAVARSDGRAREVGIRKVVGAQHADVRRQFWVEALLTTALALALGLALAQLALPAFSALAGQPLELRLVSPQKAAAALVFLTLAIGLLAGGYPAAIMSRFSPVSVLKPRSGSTRHSLVVRSIVVVQFGLSVALLVGTLFMARQLDFLRNSDLGFDHEHVVSLRVPYGESTEGGRLYRAMRSELMSSPAIQNMSSSFFVFGEEGFGVDVQRGDSVLARASMEVVDLNYVDFMGLDVIEGRSFDDRRGADMAGGAVLINESLARLLDEDELIGAHLPTRFYTNLSVTGVVRDFHFHSLHERIGPQIIAPRTAMGDGVRTILARVHANATEEALAALEASWSRHVRDAPFTYSFLDDVVDRQYREEARWHAIVRYAAGFAMLIACFGLFGLATLAASRRVKEIGIRKVLGASAASLVVLLSSDLLKLVCGSLLIAVPVAYLALSHWLAGFAYRIALSWPTFLVAGLAAIVISILTVSVQAIRAALSNPVTSLRAVE